MRRIIFAGLVSALLLAPAEASFECGQAAYQLGDYALASREWAQAAENGHPEAQFNLALLYMRGLGVPQDKQRAAELYALAAEQGDDDDNRDND